MARHLVKDRDVPSILAELSERDSNLRSTASAGRTDAWRERIRVAALDPFRGCLNALRAHLPEAADVLDAFHVTALGMKALDEVRRRVHQDTLSRRGHKEDSFYQIRRILRRRSAFQPEDVPGPASGSGRPYRLSCSSAARASPESPLRP